MSCKCIYNSTQTAQGKHGTRRTTRTKCSPIDKLAKKRSFSTFSFHCVWRNTMNHLVQIPIKRALTKGTFQCYIALLTTQQQYLLSTSHTILEVSAFTNPPVTRAPTKGMCVHTDCQSNTQTHITSADRVSNSDLWTQPFQFTTCCKHPWSDVRSKCGSRPRQILIWICKGQAATR